MVTSRCVLKNRHRNHPKTKGLSLNCCRPEAFSPSGNLGEPGSPAHQKKAASPRQLLGPSDFQPPENNEAGVVQPFRSLSNTVFYDAEASATNLQPGTNTHRPFDAFKAMQSTKERLTELWHNGFKHLPPRYYFWDPAVVIILNHWWWHSHVTKAPWWW